MERVIRRSARQRQAVQPYQIDNWRALDPPRLPGRPRNADRRQRGQRGPIVVGQFPRELYNPFEALQNGTAGELYGDIIRTPSAITGTPETYGQLKKSFGSATMDAARKDTTGAIFDILQSQGASVHYNLLSRNTNTRSQRRK